MLKYVSFLRGINVGGHKIIKMDDLKKFYEAMKFKNVSTFIASGNVLLESTEKDPGKVNKKIEKGLAGSLGYEVYSFTRSSDEMAEIVKSNPFTDVNTDKETKIYVTFFSEEISTEKKDTAESFSYEGEKFIIKGRELYVLRLKNKIKGKEIFSTNFIEKKLKVKGTTRDWNTIIKITALLNT